MTYRKAGMNRGPGAGWSYRILSGVCILVVFGLLVSAAAAQAGYRGPFEGRVLDAETRQPIQGAVVFMEWSYVRIGEKMPTVFNAAEVLTDERGAFRIKKKRSWNPWTNWMLRASAVIYKAGYGAGVHLGTPWLRKRAAIEKARSLEERKKLGPTFYLDIEFEKGLPVFLLKKLTTEEERRKNWDLPLIHGESKKLKLLRAEVNRERKSLGMEEYPMEESPDVRQDEVEGD